LIFLPLQATTAGILTSLSHCIEAMSQRDDIWKKKLEKEIEKRKKLEDFYKQQLQEVQKTKKLYVMGGPDCEVSFFRYLLCYTVFAIHGRFYVTCSTLIQ